MNALYQNKKVKVTKIIIIMQKFFNLFFNFQVFCFGGLY